MLAITSIQCGESYACNGGFIEVKNDSDTLSDRFYIPTKYDVRYIIKLGKESAIASLPYNVDNIIRINDSTLPIEIKEIQSNNLNLQAKNHIILYPEIDKSSGYLRIKKKDLGISVHAKTRKDLINEVNLQVAVLWNKYTHAPDNLLTQSAKGLRDALKEAFSET